MKKMQFNNDRIEFLKLRLSVMNVSLDKLNNYLSYYDKVEYNLSYDECIDRLAVICDIEGHGNTFKKNINIVLKNIDAYVEVMSIFE